MVISFISCSGFSQTSKKQNLKLQIKNSLSSKIYTEIFTLQLEPSIKISTNFYPIIKNDTKELVTNQAIDADGDGFWDEILMEVGIEKKTKLTFIINWDTTKTYFEPKTDIKLSLKLIKNDNDKDINSAIKTRGFFQDISNPYYRLEGPGIENDKIAFRSFFDARNGKDVFGKITDSLILNKIGFGGSWHQLHSWGMDILKVGKSLGAGALAVKEENLIYPLADADTTKFQICYKGALSASYQLRFINWDTGSNSSDGSEKIILKKGNFYYQNQINVALKDNQKLIAGFANFLDLPVVFIKHNKYYSSISTYGKQADGSNTFLGLGILFPNEEFLSYGTLQKTNQLENTTYVSLKKASEFNNIYFFSCWEKSDYRFATEEGFKTYLNDVANSIVHPIKMVSLRIIK